MWGSSPALSGVIWWEWTGGDGGAEDFGYTPKNKPAEHVLRSWFAETKAAEAERKASAKEQDTTKGGPGGQ